MIRESRKVGFKVDRKGDICSFGDSFATLRKADHSVTVNCYLSRQSVVFE
jgi:hypothetical protein